MSIKEVKITATLKGDKELFQKVNEAKQLMKQLHKKIKEINDLRIYLNITQEAK